MLIGQVVSAGEKQDALTGMTAELVTLQGPTGGSNRDRVEVIAALARVRRHVEALTYELLAEISRSPDDSLGRLPLAEVVGDALREDPKDLRKQLKIAEDVTDRVSLSGEELPPKLELIAPLVRAAEITRRHVTIVQDFMKGLPRICDADDRLYAEGLLAEWAPRLRVDEFAVFAKRLALVMDPDGDLADDQDRARKRHFTMGKQGPDLMTSGSFCLDPETAAYLEVLFAKFARRGVCNPADVEPTLDGQPSADQVRDDMRSHGQRCHDAVKALLRDVLMSGNLGQHRGLPVTVVLTADVAGLDPANGKPPVGYSAGGLIVPLSDVLRLARHAEHYLAVFDGAKSLALFHGRARRLASPEQRLVLYASERGCTFPGCSRGGYYSQAHHAERDWVAGGHTNVDELTLACDVHHPTVGPRPDQWRTRKNRSTGLTEWIPPKTVDPSRRPRVNFFHRPERRWTA